jgi:hypothetical protein
MRFDNQRSMAVLVVSATIVLGACRAGAPGSDVSDSAQPSAQPSPSADTTPPAGAGGATVRSDSVLLRTDKAQYGAGEQMTLTLENRSASSYAFNPCTRSVEREEGGAWTPVPEPDRMCTMEAWILDAKGTRTGTTELPTPLAAGRYRVVVRLTVESPGGASGSAVTAVSDPIEVR